MFDTRVDGTDIAAKTEQHAYSRLRARRKVIDLGLKAIHQSRQLFVKRLDVPPDQPQLLQHQIFHIRCHGQPPIVQRAQKPPNTSNFARNDTNTTQASDSGRKTFQPIRINWS